MYIRSFLPPWLYSPARFGNDHFSAQFMELIPQLLGLQVALNGREIVAVARAHYLGRGLLWAWQAEEERGRRESTGDFSKKIKKKA